MLARFREQLPQLSTPYIAHAQARGYQASLTWISRRQVALAGILAEDAEERQREAEQEALRRAALEPMWRRELKRLREQGQQLELPVLDRRSFRKAGSRMEYPVFDRRVILGLPRTELDRWRAEHRALVKEHQKAGARAAAARRKDLPVVAS